MRGLVFVFAAGLTACSGIDEPFANPARLQLDAPQTVHGRGLAVSVKMRTPVADAYAVIDSGTASEQLLTTKDLCPALGPLREFEWCWPSTEWTLYWTRGLANGPHTLRLVVTDSTREKSIVEKRFVTDVPDISYMATALPIGDAPTGDAFDINANGDVAGTVAGAAGPRAAAWFANTLRVLDGATSTVSAINDAGMVVGSSNGDAVVWFGDTRTVALANASAVDVNNTGVVALVPADKRSAIVWQKVSPAS